MGKQVFCHLQENRAPSHVVVMWADKHHHSNSLPSSFLPQLYVLSMMPHGQWKPAVLAVPSQLPVHSQPICWSGVVRSRKSLDSVLRNLEQ